MFVNIGPYTNEEAEILTERLLESKLIYKSLEQLLRGDIDKESFLYAVQISAESIHKNLRDESEECFDTGRSA